MEFTSQTPPVTPEASPQRKLPKVLIIIAIILAALIIAAIVVVMTVTKVQLGWILLNGRNVVDDISTTLQSSSQGMMPSVLETPHHLEGTLAMKDSAALAASGIQDVVIEFESGYLNETAQGMLYSEIFLNGLSMLDTGLYLDGDQLGFTSNMLTQGYAVDFDQDVDTSSGLTLQEALTHLSYSSDDLATLQQHRQYLQEKMTAYGKLMYKTLPANTLSRGRDTLPVMGSSRKHDYIQIQFQSNEQGRVYYTSIIETMLNDQEFIDTLDEMLKIQYNPYNILPDYDTDYSIEAMLNEQLEMTDELDFTRDMVRIYHKRFQPIALEINTQNTDLEAVQIIFVCLSGKKEMELALYIENFEEIAEAFELIYRQAGEDVHIEFTFDDVHILSTTSGPWTDREMDGQMEIEFTTIEWDGHAIYHDGVLDTEITWVYDDSLSVYQMDLTSQTTEIRADAIYDMETTLTLDIEDVQAALEMASTIEFGDRADINMHTWSGDDYMITLDDDMDVAVEQLSNMLEALSDDIAANPFMSN